MARMMHTRYANAISPTEVLCIGDLSKEERIKKYQDKYPHRKSHHKPKR